MRSDFEGQYPFKGMDIKATLPARQAFVNNAVRMSAYHDSVHRTLRCVCGKFVGLRDGVWRCACGQEMEPGDPSGGAETYDRDHLPSPVEHQEET